MTFHMHARQRPWASVYRSGVKFRSDYKTKEDLNEMYTLWTGVIKTELYHGLVRIEGISSWRCGHCGLIENRSVVAAQTQ